MTQEEKVTNALELMSSHVFGCDLAQATPRQIYKTVCLTVRDILQGQQQSFEKGLRGKKKVYYMSMEFLVGRSLKNNLYNMGLEDAYRNVLAKYGIKIEDLYSMEPDAGLGNGGLGRLASCYLDAATSEGISCTGFSIKYEFGIFRQKIVDGWQVEFPDEWLDMGGVWLVARPDDAVTVRFGGKVNGYTDENGKYRVAHTDFNQVTAIPYDMYISGHDSEAVNKLVLWQAKSPSAIDMKAFSRGEYAKALEQETMAEVISKVLYPADDHIEGKKLRLKQQYLMVSAAMQSIVAEHLKTNPNLDNLPQKAAIHINDTHPALCVPELMRILVDEYDYEWDKAWQITCATLTYTNHTVMSEALEKWNEQLFAEQLPRIYQITCEINRRLMIDLVQVYGDDRPKLDYMAVVANNEVKMANLCLAACHKVNGVSKLHSEILKNDVFHDYYHICPDKFTNVTNGIAYRRWLCQSNPQLSRYLQQLIGPDFIRDSTALSKLNAFKDDTSVISDLRKIKRENKLRLTDYIEKANGIHVDPDSVFDVQVKRLHEYKRQLLNVLQILRMYIGIKENPSADFVPRTFIFAAKASSGYFMAKQIIRLIVSVSEMIDADPDVNGKLKVVFIEDYKVSLAEIIIPAADISEQISVAGKEASGTGNMKLMINGAVTVGTLDGANIEIMEQVGRENMFVFGMTAAEVEALWRKGYRPNEFLRRCPELEKVFALLGKGIGGTRFDDIVNSLLNEHYGTADQYMSVADFADYERAQDEISKTYTDALKFGRMSLINIANAGIFSADRAIKEYAEKIWNV